MFWSHITIVLVTSGNVALNKSEYIADYLAEKFGKPSVFYLERGFQLFEIFLRFFFTFLIQED